MAYPTIPINRLDQFIDQGQDILIIDLRNRASYEKAHIRGAVNIPFQELEEQASRLSSDKTLVFYCSRGGQSMLACNYLSARGLQVVNTAGGLAFYRGKYLIRT